MSKRSFDFESGFEKCQSGLLIVKAYLKNAKTLNKEFNRNQPNFETQPQIISLVARTTGTTALMDTKITISLTD